VLHSLTLSIVLFGFWLLLSGHYGALLLILGIVSCVVVVLIAHRMDIIDRESHPIHLTTKIPQYCLWLIWEIVKANITVTKLIWNPQLSINPTVFRVKASQPSELGKVIYANSITLTPGTVSMNVENDEIEVHALTRELAEDLQSGVMDRRVAEME